jgi:hypothetical protein
MLHIFLHIIGQWLAELHNLHFSGSDSLNGSACYGTFTCHGHLGKGEPAPTVVPTFAFLHEAAETLIQS